MQKTKINILKYWRNTTDSLINVLDRPCLIDGFILDLNRHGVSVRDLEFAHEREHFPTFLSQGLSAARIEIFPKDSGKGLNGYFIERFQSADEEVNVKLQRMFVQYFRLVYPDCQFYASRKPETLIAVRLKGKTVGAIMPLIPECYYRVVKPLSDLMNLHREERP